MKTRPLAAAAASAALVLLLADIQPAQAALLTTRTSAVLTSAPATPSSASPTTGSRLEGREAEQGRASRPQPQGAPGWLCKIFKVCGNN